MNRVPRSCGISAKSDLRFVVSERKTNTDYCVGDRWPLRISLANGLRQNFCERLSRHAESTALSLVHGRQAQVWRFCGKRRWMEARSDRLLLQKAGWVV